MSEFLDRIAKLPAKRLALLAADLQARLERVEQARATPIAVVGMACRFPGGADDPARFWRLLQDGVDAVTTVPAERFDVEAYYDARPDAPGKISTRHGGFLTEVDRFDAGLFGIAPREAQSMDPQQRLVLETAWEALENAGHAPDRLAGSRTGVFIGICNLDYYQMVMRQDPAALDAYVATGSSHSVAAGRIAYVLGLAGPNLAVDTACSSSLVAVHLACQSLRSGESRMALAAGVNLALLPDTTLLLSRAHMMAPDGRCKAFDAAADGFVRGEGCGVIVLKRLAEALADGDRILAVIRASAMNHDGRSNGLTAPSGPAQEAVIREAISSAGLTPGEVSYVETHGTGTSLGDPIEARALGAVFGPGRPATRPLMIGSVKTNIGHLEAAAGIAGIVKVILALRHAEIPPHLHLETPSPHIPWDQLPLAVPTRRTVWQVPDGRRIAGVSSFGFSGTNVHVVLEEAPVAAPPEPGPERPRHVLTLSARHEETLREAASRLAAHLEHHPELAVADVCFTASTGRAQLAHRIALPVAGLDEARTGLAALARGDAPSGAVQGRVGVSVPEPVFLFTGQGAQRVDMARELYDGQPVFREALERCDALLRGHLDRPLLSVLYPGPGEASALDDTGYAQPALFALEWALAELWRAWGVTPSAVLGHSVGEYVAACVAGMCSLEEGLALVAERGRLMQALPREGAMAALFASEAVVTAALRGREAETAIAAVNGPEHTVISGRTDAVIAVMGELQARGVGGQRLNVSHAFHSPLLDPVLEALERLAARVTWMRPRMGVVSNLTGGFATNGELASGAYWGRHAREPVRFADGVRALAQAGSTVFVEIGPAPTLLGMAARCLPDDTHAWLPSLRPGRGDWETMLASLAALWVRGVPVDWEGFERGYRRRRVELPTSPFRRERYWVDAAPERRPRPTAGGRSMHPLLGDRLRSALDTAQYEAVVGPRQLAYLGEHRVHGVAVAPASAFIEMALAAGQPGAAPIVIDDLRILAPLQFLDEGSRVVQVLAAPEEAAAASITIVSLASDDAAAASWRRHATCRAVTRGVNTTPTAVEDLEAVRARCQESWTAERHYARLHAQGIELGPSFQGVAGVRRRDGEALAEIGLPAAAGAATPYRWHPALLDAAFQALGAAWPEGREGTYVLTGLGRLEVWQAPAGPALAHATVDLTRADSPQAATGEVTVLDHDGRVLARACGLELRPLASDAPAEARDWCYEVAWDPAEPAPEPAAPLLPDPSQITASVELEVEALATAHRLDAHDPALNALETVAMEHVVYALRELGWDPRPGARIRVEVLAAELGVVPGQRRLLSRMLAMLAEDGGLATENGEGAWTVRGLPALEPAVEARALASVSAPAELALLERCGRHLAAVLRGSVDPLPLLFPQGDLESVERIYESGPAARVFNTLVRRTVETAVAALPPGRRLRVLEIGAGTGATTTTLLPALPPATTEYVFTDVSPLFLARAREKFRDVPFLTCRSLDIERDPEPQGFTAGGFDLVVAANVLHATRDLRQTLRHTRSLLAPQGLLVLLEGTTPYRWVDLTFGLTEGWWRFTDTDLRPSYALLAPARWEALLAGESFRDPRSLPAAISPGRARSSQSVILARASRAAAATGWLVLADQQGVGARVAALLRGRGEQCLVVSAGAPAGPAGADQWFVRPEHPDDFRRLVDHVRVSGEVAAPLSVLHLWALDADAGSVDALEVAEALGPGSLLHLAQALAASPLAARARLWVATRGAQPATEDGAAVAVAQAPVWGVGRVLALEHPELWGGLVDLDPESPDPAGALVAELSNPDGEDQVALRSGGRRVPRLRRRAWLAGPAPALRAEATYLVTGGLGGLGLKVGQWLARGGARNLVLLGRQGIEGGTAAETARRQAGVRAIEALGATVRVAACDVSDAPALTALLADIRASMPPLRGLVHAAAALDATPVRELDLQRVRAVMRPKATGAWLLDRETRELDLDFFALFSSTTALLGATGFAHYAAANQFLDALAHARRSRGARAVSVNWGIWDEMRVASDEDRRGFAETGLRPMASDTALDLLGAALGGDAVQPVVAAIDWAVLAPLYETRRRRPFLAEVRTRVARAPEVTAATNLRRRLDSATPEARRDLALQWVREEIATVLRLPLAEVDAERGLFDMGLDSLMALDLRRRLEAGVGRSLPSTLTFNYPTAMALAAFLAADRAASAPVPPVPAAGDPDDLSEEELAELLARKLERLR